MPVDVVNAHQGQSTRRRPPRRGQPHWERPLEVRPAGRHGIDPIKADARIRHRGREDRTDAPTWREAILRHYSPKRAYVHLRGRMILERMWRPSSTTAAEVSHRSSVPNTEQAHPFLQTTPALA